ncbi:MAG: hypothetical protein A2086_14330 [Spirochaetes bacterium GWD1_27_9]|nr:MAG: hypothetical protein A2Z98_14395 [Spirochaetes bacterium GWB1_27_13]OHD41235.1 MAG: hypothetical protein A2086_14330 [Spirochaetes bacterium GWD1_27_9]
MEEKNRIIEDKITFLHIIYSIWGWFTFILVNIIQFCIAPFILLVTFPFDKDRKVMAYLIKFFCNIFYFLNFLQKNHYDFNGLKAPKKGERRIYVINHSSMFDSIIIYSLPGAIKALMKEAYLSIPLVGWISYLAGNVVLKASTSDGMKIYFDVIKKLESGSPFVIFPEGTKSKDSKIGRFYNGIFRIALETKSDIVPVLFDTWNSIRPGAFWIRDTKIHIKMLETIKYEDIKDYSMDKLSNIVRYKMIEGLVDLRNKRRMNEKNYYRKNPKYEKLDQEMKDDLVKIKEKIESKNKKGLPTNQPS